MAGLNFQCAWNDIATAAAAWKTMARIKAPTNQMVLIKGIGLGFDGTAGDAEPVDIRFINLTADDGQSSPGTTTHVSQLTTATIQTDYNVNYTADPSRGTNILYQTKLHPQGGVILQLPFDNFLVKEAGSMAFEVFTPAQVNCSGYLLCEE